MTVVGRRATLPSTFPCRRTTIDAMVTEHNVNTQLIANMEKVSARVRVECLTVANIVLDSTSVVIGPSSVSYVNWFLVGTSKDVVVKSAGPVSPTANVVIGMDLFVAFSTTKTNAMKLYRSSGLRY